MLIARLKPVPDAELRRLAARAAVADEGSFGRAAARLGYSQSTISQQIAALEKAVGGAVFDRPGGPKPVRITPLGALVLAHGRDLLAKAAAMAAALDRFKAGDGRVDIGTFQSVSNVIVPPVVRRLREEHPRRDSSLLVEVTGQPHVRHHLQPSLRPRGTFLPWAKGRTHSPLAARAIGIHPNEAAKTPEDDRQPIGPNRPTASPGSIP